MLKLAPLTKRRLALFKANKRGSISLIIFLMIFFFTLFAEIISNDKPLFVSYQGRYYFPAFTYTPETLFGGEFDIEVDFKDPYIKNLIGDETTIIWPLLHYSYDTINYTSLHPAPAPPSFDNLLGTDDQGRDVLARLIYGFRLSVLFGLALTILSSCIGIFAGAIQGFYGGKIDLYAQRFIEIWAGMPTLFILIILSSMITPSAVSLLLILLLFSWTALVGVVRAEFLRVRNFDYIKAARSLGVSNFTIIYRHALPNAMVATLTFLPFVLNGAITTLTALDFLGFGLPAGSPSLGDLLAQGKANLQAPWLGLTAFFVLAIMLSLLIFIGEAVRDAFDPRKSLDQKGH